MTNPFAFYSRLNISPWLDIAALLLWGSLLLKYAITGQLALLIHPNYFGLCIASGVVLLVLGLGRLWQHINQPSGRTENVQHITLLPHNLGNSLLILVAIAGLSVSPAVLASQTAIQRGLTESLPLTRSQPQSFRTNTNPEERTLIEWIRTLNAYPEPDAYTGQPVKVTGFVTHLPQLPENYVMVSRFVLTCCAVDAYPVGLPVKLSGDRTELKPDTWVEVEGQMMTENFSLDPESTDTTTAQRQLVIAAKAVTVIPTPKNPYDY